MSGLLHLVQKYSEEGLPTQPVPFSSLANVAALPLRTSVNIRIIRPHRMQSVHNKDATDGVAWSVCLMTTFVSPAKTAESIEMSIGW